MNCPKCGTWNKARRYVGSQDTYYSCSKSGCFETYGGEETPAKKALIAKAAASPVSEDMEVEGLISGV